MHSDSTTLFRHLWDNYRQVTPSAEKIHRLLGDTQGSEIVNDHIALRTFNLEKVNLSKLAEHFLALGYTEGGDYHFEAKKLYANHFTVSVNHLARFHSVEDINKVLKGEGYVVNSSGGEVKGSPEELLEQSSTMADRIEVRFSDQTRTIPSCFYEFARRYPKPDGQLYSGFVAASADKIFESTNAGM